MSPRKTNGDYYDIIIPYFVKYTFVSRHACIKQIYFLSPILFLPFNMGLVDDIQIFKHC